MFVFMIVLVIMVFIVFMGVTQIESPNRLMREVAEEKSPLYSAGKALPY